MITSKEMEAICEPTSDCVEHMILKEVFGEAKNLGKILQGFSF